MPLGDADRDATQEKASDDERNGIAHLGRIGVQGSLVDPTRAGAGALCLVRLRSLPQCGTGPHRGPSSDGGRGGPPPPGEPCAPRSLVEEMRHIPAIGAEISRPSREKSASLREYRRIREASMSDTKRCRFCGLALVEDDADFHPACVDAAHDDNDGPKGSEAHPMYGSKPGPLVVPG